jgi:hypothetical protein
MRGTVYVFFAITSPAVLKEERGKAADVHQFRLWMQTRRAEGNNSIQTRKGRGQEWLSPTSDQDESRLLRPASLTLTLPPSTRLPLRSLP